MHLSSNRIRLNLFDFIVVHLRQLVFADTRQAQKFHRTNVRTL